MLALEAMPFHERQNRIFNRNFLEKESGHKRTSVYRLRDERECIRMYYVCACKIGPTSSLERGMGGMREKGVKAVQRPSEESLRFVLNFHIILWRYFS